MKKNRVNVASKKDVVPRKKTVIVKKKVPMAQLNPNAGYKKLKNPVLGDISCTPAFTSDLLATVDLSGFTYMAAIIMGIINDGTGYIPTTGDITPGYVYLYLVRCFAAYLIKCECFEGDLGELVKYSKYSIPTGVAVIFRHSAKAIDKKYGAKYRVNLSGFSNSYIEALTKPEGFNGYYVITSYAANNEGIYTVGSTLNNASMTDALNSLLTDMIASSCKSVSVLDIPTGYAKPYLFGKGLTTGYVALHDSPPWVFQLRLWDSDVDVVPYVGSEFVVYRDSIPSPTPDFYLYKAFLYLAKTIKYTSDLTPQKVVGRHGYDPWKFNMRVDILNFSKFVGLVTDWLIGMGNITTVWAAVNVSSWWNVILIYYSSITSKAPFLCRNSLTTNLAFYANDVAKHVQVPAFLGNMGVLPCRVRNTFVLPEWNARTNSLQVFMQAATAYVASYAATSQVIPWTMTTPAGVLIAGIAPLALGVFVNNIPTVTWDELIRASGTTLVASTVSFPVLKPYDPIAIDANLSTNTFSPDGVALFYYPTETAQANYRVVSEVGCKEAPATAMFTTLMVGPFFKTLKSSSFNPFRNVVVSSNITNGPSPFAAGSNVDIDVSVTDYYEGLVMGKNEGDKKLVAVVDVFGLIKDYVNDGGPPGYKDPDRTLMKDLTSTAITWHIDKMMSMFSQLWVRDPQNLAAVVKQTGNKYARLQGDL